MGNYTVESKYFTGVGQLSTDEQTDTFEHFSGGRSWNNVDFTPLVWQQRLKFPAAPGRGAANN